MLSNPNMSLIEFAQKVGSIHLQPHHKAVILYLEGCARSGVTPDIRALQEPRQRKLANGVIKNTLTGIAEAPASFHISEYTGDGQ